MPPYYLGVYTTLYASLLLHHPGYTSYTAGHHVRHWVRWSRRGV